MPQLRLVGGITLTEGHLKDIGNWRGASIIIKRVADILEAEPFLFGGLLRDWFWKVTKGIDVGDEVDYDVFLATDKDINSALRDVARSFKTLPIMIVHEDTFRVQEKGLKIDFKLGVSVSRAPIDFTVNAIFAPLRPIFEGKGAPIYAANLSDLEDMVLRHISTFNLYPFHMVRGIRLVTQYKLKIAPETLNLYRKSSKQVQEISPPLIHRELSRAVNGGFERAVWAIAVTEFAPYCFASLKPVRKRGDIWLSHIEFAQRLISLFNPQNRSAEGKYVRKYAPAHLLKKEFAPGGRNLLYCYFIASLLLPANPTAVLNDLISLNFYPAERFIILSCVNGIQGKQKVETAHSLVQPFLRAYNTLAGGK